jgi:hypothetical protein
MHDDVDIATRGHLVPTKHDPGRVHRRVEGGGTVGVVLDPHDRRSAHDQATHAASRQRSPEFRRKKQRGDSIRCEQVDRTLDE